MTVPNSNGAGGSGISRRRVAVVLRPSARSTPALTAPLKDALAAYYYPGTWDWAHELKQSLVHKALKRALDDGGKTHALDAATALLDSYMRGRARSMISPR